MYGSSSYNIYPTKRSHNATTSFQAPRGVHKKQRGLKITRTKKKCTSRAPSKSLQISQHNDTSKNLFKCIVHPKKKRMPKSSGKYEYLHQWVGVCHNSEGFQSVHSGHLMNNKSALLASNTNSYVLYNSNTASNRYTLPNDGTIPAVVASTTGAVSLMPQNPWDLNPFKFSTPDTTIYTSSLAPSTRKVYLDNIDTMHMLTNHGNVSVWVDFFFLTPKKDTNLGPGELWNDIMTRKIYGESTANAPLTTRTVNVQPGAVNSQHYGQSPLYHSEFNKMYRILKRFSFPLQPGDNVKLIGKFYLNYLLNLVEIQERQEFMKGLTIVPFWILRPSVVVISDTVNETQQAPTIGISGVTCMVTEHYKYRAVVDQGISMERGLAGFISNSIHGTFAAPAMPGNEQVTTCTDVETTVTIGIQ